MIRAEQLVKRYGPTLAVDGISFEIAKGSIVGFLGPNGAGKSTTIRMLTGYLPPTSGRAMLAGHDALTQAAEARRSLGYLPESNALYLEMRVDEYLHFVGKLHDMPRVHRRQRMDIVVDRCGLSLLRRRTIGRLSKGNRQRVGIAAALLHDPAVLILDEPTSGLDPNQMGQVRELIRDLAGQHTILLSSHLLPEIQRVSDRVLIIANGRLVADGSLDELQKQNRSSSASSTLWVEAKCNETAIKEAVSSIAAITEAQVTPSNETGDGWVRGKLTVASGQDPRQAVAEAMSARGFAVRELHWERESLEAFFIRVTAPPTHDEPGVATKPEAVVA